MKKLAWNGLLTLAFIAVMVGFAASGLAEDSVAADEGPASSTADPLSSPSVSTAEIEAAIHELHQPLDHDRISQVLFQLGRLQHSREHERLQGLFDERMQALAGMPAMSSELAFEVPGTTQVDLESGVSGEDLMMRTETLNLGPNATADDLRARDRLVSDIAGIRDPVTREKLLTRLEERERTSEGLTERP